MKPNIVILRRFKILKSKEKLYYKNNQRINKECLRGDEKYRKQRIYTKLLRVILTGTEF